MTTTELIEILTALNIDGTTRVFVNGLFKARPVFTARLATISRNGDGLQIEVEEGETGEEVVMVF